MTSLDYQTRVCLLASSRGQVTNFIFLNFYFFIFLFRLFVCCFVLII